MTNKPFAVVARSAYPRVGVTTRLALVGLLLAVGACADQTDAAPNFRTTTEGHENKVERLVWPHAIAFKAKQNGLDEAQRAQLAQAIETAGGAELVHVRIAAPEAGKKGQDKQSKAQYDSIVGALRKMGVAPSRIAADTSAAAPLKGAFSVSLERYVVTPPTCGDWSDPLGQVDARQVAANWGCATNANLGMMAADPRDLVIGRDLSPGDAPHAVNSMDRYRTDKVTPPSTAGTGAKSGGG